MDQKLKTNFTPSLSLFQLTRMRDEANQIAIDMGFKRDSLEQDAFRHAYVSAKMQEAYGGTIATSVGTGNEVARHIFNKNHNPGHEWKMDEYNNAYGRYIERKISESGTRGDEKEWQLHGLTGMRGITCRTRSINVLLHTYRALLQAVCRCCCRGFWGRGFGRR